MALPIPKFAYHPDPFASGVVVGADEQCECCEEKRTLFYVGSFYAAEEVEKLCLWCVADGSAAKKFEGEFVDAENFGGQEIDENVVAEVTLRTPSFQAWQQEQWLVHCGDACEFHGYPSVDELQRAKPEAKEEWASRSGMNSEDWERVVTDFQAERAGFYKFKCRHCDQILFAFDYN